MKIKKKVKVTAASNPEPKPPAPRPPSMRTSLPGEAVPLNLREKSDNPNINGRIHLKFASDQVVEEVVMKRVVEFAEYFRFVKYKVVELQLQYIEQCIAEGFEPKHAINLTRATMKASLEQPISTDGPLSKALISVIMDPSLPVFTNAGRTANRGGKPPG